jgi:hypothetical protein
LSHGMVPGTAIKYVWLTERKKRAHAPLKRNTTMVPLGAVIVFGLYTGAPLVPPTSTISTWRMFKLRGEEGQCYKPPESQPKTQKQLRQPRGLERTYFEKAVVWNYFEEALDFKGLQPQISNVPMRILPWDPEPFRCIRLKLSEVESSHAEVLRC